MSFLKSLAKTLVPRRCRLVIRKVYQQLLYVGYKFVCPCCRGHFRRFLSAGVVPRPNARCPRCHSLERHRLLWLYLQSRTNLFSERLKVLHFAPEYFFGTTFRAMSNLDYISADLEASRAQVKMDITNILYDDNFFDVILCSHVLEHVVDDQKAMGELFRVLKPGGWAILQSPVKLNLDKTFEDFSILSPEDRERVFGQNDHVRIYGRDYRERLEKAGFTVKVDNYAKQLGERLIKKHGLPKDQAIYFCTKLNREAN